jgi:hypothetical protein
MSTNLPLSCKRSQHPFATDTRASGVGADDDSQQERNIAVYSCVAAGRSFDVAPPLAILTVFPL